MFKKIWQKLQAIHYSKSHIPVKSIWTNPVHFIAFGFGTGAMPVAPGTFGTLIAIPLYLLIRDLPLAVYLSILFIAIIGGIWICTITEKNLGIHDHSGIVWDEICGYLITMIGAPSGWQWIIIGFLLFRIFDVWKPWPIKWVDKSIGGGLGVMLDDVAAGIYSLAVLQIIFIYSR